MGTPNLIPIIKTLETVEFDGELEMEESRVISDGVDHAYHECGTVHCVAGWYVVAKLQADSNHPLHGAADVGFKLGIGMIDDDSGLTLKKWAHTHPELWGNKNGGSIWWRRAAWDYAENLSDVIKHLWQVQKRIEAHLAN